MPGVARLVEGRTQRHPPFPGPGAEALGPGGGSGAGNAVMGKGGGALVGPGGVLMILMANDNHSRHG